MENSLGILPEAMLGIVVGLFAVVFVLLIMTMIRLGKVRSRYNKMINGGHPENIEQLLITMQSGMNQLTAQNETQHTEIEQIKKQMKKMKSHVGVQRYNAFSQEGTDLSFSIAVLDAEQDGVVLTGIHGREQTFIYAKPIEKGQSTYSLSPEEKQIIDRIALKPDA
ncbi:MAG: hypothetical protein JWM44_3755 [Bacilli bacterium]|jgi:cell division protein FtsB|nr:hypothetical protein [Bacilli bacterium]